MFKLQLAAPRFVAKANDNDALIPEIWSREALMTLMSNTVMASLVYRDFSAMVASHGDVVNTSRPADFSGKRKTDADNVTDQDAISPNIPVPLNQHFHVSYVIKDGELSKALPDLLERYMEPAARELAEKIDQVLCGQAARLLENQVGQPGAVTSLNVDEHILDADEKLNDNRCPKAGRRLVMSSRFNRAALGAEIVVEADKRGDSGTALREASVGRIYGFDSFMDQNVAHVNASDADTTANTLNGALLEGTTTVEVTSIGPANGEYIVIDGSNAAHEVISGGGSTTLEVTPAVTADVADGAAVTEYNSCLINTGTTYPVGYAKEINVDGFATDKPPQVGQMVQILSYVYTVIAVTDNGTDADLLLDRPLDEQVADGVTVRPGPAGSASLAFVRNAIALVSRPLATVANTMGARSAVTSFDGLSMRVTMQYDSQSQGTRVTFDLLCGVAILDERLACVVWG